MRVTDRFLILFICLFLSALYCEHLIYYILALQCSWPGTENSEKGLEPLKAFILADTHLLGPRKGHWLDKWRREWQMNRAYAAIITIHKPDVIFVLGDLFDEGEWSNSKQFQNYVDRFHELFPVDEGSVMHVVAGNHDIGFHNFIRYGNVQRFEKNLNSSLVELITLKNNHFVLINSMAMEGDGCSMCNRAREDIKIIAETLKCAEHIDFCHEGQKKFKYSRPILMQHFPLHRVSDSVCTGPDSPPSSIKNKRFRPKLDSLSLEATTFLATQIQPRVVFGGHTHHGCLVHHKYEDPKIFDFLEYSVPSFSWRNRPNPKYMLVTITPNDYSVNTCSLPEETTIIVTAVLMVLTGIWKMMQSGPHHS